MVPFHEGRRLLYAAGQDILCKLLKGICVALLKMENHEACAV